MLANIGPMQLGIILLIVILIFGTRRLKTMGEDVGGGLKGIREGFREAEKLDKDFEKNEDSYKDW